jgi:flagellar FliL protein
MGSIGQAICPEVPFELIGPGLCDMSKAAEAVVEAVAPAKPNGRRRLLLLAIPVLLAGTGAGLWFSGILPSLLGLGHRNDAHGGTPGHGEASHGAPEAAAIKPTASVELPEMVANLNVGPGRRPSYIKLHARIELSRAEDVAAAQAGMPRLLDLFQTYLREMRPEELRGSTGTWRLREELIARANIAIAPGRVTDVLFTELLVQ